jgi:hypothetical protein
VCDQDNATAENTKSTGCSDAGPAGWLQAVYMPRATFNPGLNLRFMHQVGGAQATTASQCRLAMLRVWFRESREPFSLSCSYLLLLPVQLSSQAWPANSLLRDGDGALSLLHDCTGLGHN